MAKLAIKSDNRKQNLLLPPSLDELVPENHMVRVVDAVIDRLDISDILSTYRGGGNSAFNPKMMLKVLVFAYLSNVYSSRRIEDLLRRDIYFMWLAGMNRPDFRTINYYRGKRLKEGFDAVFTDWNHQDLIWHACIPADDLYETTLPPNFPRKVLCRE